MALFVGCRSCALPVKNHELACPHCGAKLSADNTTATAVALILSLGSACSPGYGVAGTGGYEPLGGEGGSGGEGGFSVPPDAGGQGGSAGGDGCELAEARGGAPPCTWQPSDVESPWSFVFGGEVGNDAALDADLAPNGDILVVGGFAHEITFGCETLRGAGEADAFIARLDSRGNPLWSHGWGDCRSQRAEGVAFDGAGDIAVFGHFSGSMQVGPDTLVAETRYGGAFLAKLDADGDALWTRSFEAPKEGFLHASHMAARPDGAVVMVGSFSGTVDFGEGPITSGATSFVVELGADGTFSWLRLFDAQPNSALADELGNVYVAGSYSGTVSFGGPDLTSTGANEDTFLLKLDADGNHVWSRSFANDTLVYGTTLAVDGAGDIVMAGFGAGELNFGNGPLFAFDEAAFLVKLGSDGSTMFATLFAASANQGATSVAIDATDNIWITVAGSGSVDFGGGVLDGSNGSMFLAGFDPLGAPISSAVYVGSWWTRRLLIDPAGQFVVAGDVQTPVDLPGGPLQPSGDASDAFVANLGPPGVALPP